MRRNIKQINSSAIKIEHYKTSKPLIYSMLWKFWTQKVDQKKKRFIIRFKNSK